MLKLRILLLSKWFYWCLIILTITCVSLKITHQIIPKIPQVIYGTVTKNIKYDKYTAITVNGNYPVLIYLKKPIPLGSKIKINGEFELPKPNTNINGFNYQKYLLSKGILFTSFEPVIKVIKPGTGLFQIKQNIIRRINNSKNKAYLNAFVLGNSNYLNDDVKDSYMINGISHLLAISGMQVSFLAGLILLILNKLNELPKYLITSVIIIFLVWMADVTPSMLRAGTAFIIVLINRYFYFHINPIRMFVITLTINLLIAPFDVYNIGFWYSYLISFFLIINQQHLVNISKLALMFKVSLIAFIAGAPITCLIAYQLNLSSIIYNIVFVPLVDAFIYPLNLLSLIIPKLASIIILCNQLLERLSLAIMHFRWGIIYVPKPHLNIVIILYLVILMFSYQNKLRFILIYALIILSIPVVQSNQYFELYMIDVGQGDSTLIRSPANSITVLIDTGGEFNKPHQDGKTVINFVRSLGIKKLDYLILTHGDFDHIGDAAFILKNIDVKYILINKGTNTKLETKIKLSHKNKLVNNIDLPWLKIINTPLADNENDNSIVLSLLAGQHKMLLLGDYSSAKLNNTFYDAVKISHHGSNNPVNMHLINSHLTSNTLISVGLNNTYHHPNDQIIRAIEQEQIRTYRSDLHGMIKIVFKRQLDITKTLNQL